MLGIIRTEFGVADRRCNRVIRIVNTVKVDRRKNKKKSGKRSISPHFRRVIRASVLKKPLSRDGGFLMRCVGECVVG